MATFNIRSLLCSSSFLSRDININILIEEEKIERICNSIQRKLETLGESEVPSKVIGEIVMDQLADLDQVAYVRFASVYRNFHEVKDFEAFIGTLSDETN